MMEKLNDKVGDKKKQKIRYPSNVPIPPPVPPKRPSSYFMLFRNDIIISMKQKQPNLVLSLRKIAEIAKQIWEETDQKTKQRYRSKGEILMQIYKLEKSKYEQKYGKIKRKTRRPNRTVIQKDILLSSSDSD